MDITTFSEQVKSCKSSVELVGLETGLTMSTLEISELTGSRHDNVKVALQTLVGSKIIVVPARQDRQFTDKLGRSRSEEAYVLDERSSLVLVARLSPEFTAKIVDQWLEMRTLIRTQQLLIEKQAQEKAQAISDKLKIAKEAEAVADRRLRGCKDLLTCFTPGALSRRIKQDPEWRQTCIDSLNAFLKDPRLSTYYAGEHDNAVKDLVFVQDKLKELKHFVMTYCKLKPEGIGKPQPDLREALSYKRNFLSL